MPPETSYAGFRIMVAQMLRTNGYELYYHEFTYQADNNETVKPYEVDFLLVRGKRIVPIEVKSSSYRSHKSFDYFKAKYDVKMNERYLIYAKDLDAAEDVTYIPIYMTCCL